MTNKVINLFFLLFLGVLNTTFCQSLFETRLNEDCSLDLIWAFDNNDSYDYFTIQRSEDGKQFKSLGEVYTSDLNENDQYVFSDKYQFFHNYYRLKIITKDGSTTLSKTIQTKNDCGVDGYMEVYPSTIMKKNTRLSINFITSKMTIPVGLYENEGDPVRIFQVDTPKEWNTLSMDVSDLDSGTYFLEVGEIGMSKITIINEEESLSSK